MILSCYRFLYLSWFLANYSSNSMLSVCDFDLFFFFKISQIFHTIQYFTFSVWLTSLRIMPSKFIHAASNDTVSLFCTNNNTPLNTYLKYIKSKIYTFSLSLHLPVDTEHLVCFSTLAIVKNAVIKCEYIYVFKIISFPL